MYQIVHNCKIRTMANPLEFANGMLINSGKVEQLYWDTIPRVESAEYIDLQGADILPGFIDTHTHSFEGGLYSAAVNLMGVDTIAETLALLSDYYTVSNQQNINMIFAFRFDENQVAERRFPFLSEMDQVCPDKPLLLRRIDGHSCVVNSFAQKQFFSAFPGLAAANIAANAAISGELNDLIVHWFHSNCSPQMIVAAYHQAAAIAAQNGHTSIHTMIGDAKDSITHYQLMRDHLADFPIEYILYPQSFNIAAALDAGATRIGGCILADGSLGSYTAALSRPYQDKQDEYGRLYQTDAFWDQFLTAATTAGLQVGIHCIGDRAIRQINDVYLRLQRKYQHDLRHEIIHAELTPDDLVAEIALSHAVCVMQPAFDQYWGGETGFYHRVLGRERALQMNRFHSLSQQGITVTGGSDWYITELDAIRGIIAALQHHNPQERLTPFQAISLYTKNAAWLAHDENRLGQLAPGYQADFVCLDADLMQPENAERAKVIATYKAGKCIYE